MGKITYCSNPSRNASAPTDGWTRVTNDVADRTVEVASFATAAQPPATGTNSNWTGSVTTTYDAEYTTVTDQAGKVRRSKVDGLGRLVRVDEPTTSGLGSNSSPNQPTSYNYSVLGNLISVSQGAQTRTFTYDSLSRLRTAVNPESGTVTYVYDDSGNLTTKTDARGVATNFAYDALNRPTAKTYSDSTPRVDYFYDTQTLPSGAPSFNRGNATGRLVGVTYGGGTAGTYRGYDLRGAVLRQYQRTDGVDYLVEATYKPSGSMSTQTYPSVPGASDCRTISYTNDSAGRLSSLSSTATSYAPAASVNTISYEPSGGLLTETYGNSLVHTVSYNSRLQADQIKLGTSGSPTSIASITYNYGTSNNSGNLLSTSYAGGGLTFTQSFGYDELNRLTTSQEGASWSQTNSYDRYGNRSVSGGVLTFNSGNNRITTVGYNYDAAGNLINDTAHIFAFDAENKITKVDNVSAYVYDGEGQRVRKLVNENLRFIYGIGGQPIAEYDGSNGMLKKEYIYGASGLLATLEPTAVNANGTRYTTADQLGSARLVTDSSASVVSRHDYMPFGEELFNGGRTLWMGYGASDGLRQKFTSKERDNETALDYFNARYYGSTQGRFTSSDPLLSSGRVYDPQTWNRYSYTLNNPVKYVDPAGLYEFSAALGGSATDDELRMRAGNDKKALKAAEQIISQRNQFRTALAGAAAAARNGDLTASQQQSVTRAVKAYGTENDGNQVIVGFGRTGTGRGAFTDGKDMNDYISVTFNAGHKGNDLIIDVAHEGSHVADNQDFNDTHGMYDFGGPSDISQYETERRAYEVSSFVAQAVGKGSYPNNLDDSSDSRKHQVWNSGWKAADRETKRSAGINRLISTYYGVTANKPGWTFGEIKDRVP